MLHTPRRERLADAALAILAQEGGRGLTHRAVDRFAGVAEGTTSYYFRTRHRLLEAAVHRLAAVDSETIAALPGPSPDEVVEALAAVVTAVTTERPARQLARLELALEGVRQPELQAVLAESGRVIHATLTEKLHSSGVADAAERATALLVTVDGLLVDRLAGAGARVGTTGEVRDLLRESLRRPA